MPDPYRAAILTGPRGPFAVIELTADQERRLSADDRRQVSRCFKEKHHNLPVVFVTASPSTLHAIQACLRSHRPAVLPWVPFEHGPAAAGPN